MKPKIFLATVAALLMVCASVTPVSAEIQVQNQIILSEEIPYEVIVLACQAVEKEKVATAEVALCWYRDGLMTITKVDTGAYQIITPGGDQIGILITDVF